MRWSRRRNQRWWGGKKRQAMDGRGFTGLLRGFLPVARRSWFNYACVIGMLQAPIAALIALGDDPGSTPFVQTAVDLVLTIAGPLLVSNRLAGLGPEAMPADREATRRRYFALHWIRAAATWTAFVLFLVALVVL
jgi:hypothetical protein